MRRTARFMGGAQPLAATMNGAAFLGVDVDAERIRRRVEQGYCDRMEADLDHALQLVVDAKTRGTPLSVGLVGNIADVVPELVRRGITPDVVTDQTSAHDLRVGYIPVGYSLESAAVAREQDPKGYEAAVLDSMCAHVEAMLTLKARGAIAFDYGNNLRGQVADLRGMAGEGDVVLTIESNGKASLALPDGRWPAAIDMQSDRDDGGDDERGEQSCTFHAIASATLLM